MEEELIILNFNEYSTGEGGYLVGPFTIFIGVFSSRGLAEEAAQKSKYKKEEYVAQFGSAINDFEYKTVVLDKAFR